MLLLSLAFAGQCAWLVARGLVRPGGVFEVPFLAGAMGVAFVLPQLPALAADRSLPEGAYETAMLFTILCFTALALGWSDRARALRSLRWEFDERRLLLVAALLSAVGGAFHLRLRELPGDVAVMSGLSGTVVMQLFFAKLLTYGLAIGALCLMRRPSWPALAIVVADGLLTVERIVVTGKRGETFEFLMILALAAYFQRGWKPPRALVLGGLVAGTLLMGSLHEYREITARHDRPTWSEVARIRVVDNFLDAARGGSTEMRNAVRLIHAAGRDMTFDFGTFHWNVLVFNYVPAQLVGSRAKQMLMLDLAETNPRDYNPHFGSTETGMADAFRSFWWFGWIKFLLIAALTNRLWRAALEGWAAPQLVYMLTVAAAANTVSHHTQWVLSAWVHLGLFLLPALWLARARPSPAAAPA
jgi:hypothetical protein